MASILSAIEGLFSGNSLLFGDVLNVGAIKTQSTFGVDGETKFAIRPIPLSLLDAATEKVGAQNVSFVRSFCRAKFPESQDQQNRCSIDILQRVLIEGESAVPKPPGLLEFQQQQFEKEQTAKKFSNLLVFGLLGAGAYILYKVI